VFLHGAVGAANSKYLASSAPRRCRRRSLPPIPQRDFHRLDDVALQHLHHFQLEAADAILHGANPGEIPFYQVSKFELSINLKTAKAARAYGTSTLLATADRVVE
jgi:hypothetical protein